MSEQIQTLKNDLNTLKVRVFDLNEEIALRDNELTNYRNLLGRICQSLELDGSRGVEPEAVIAAIEALKFTVPEEPVEAEGEKADGEQLLTEA